MVYYFHGVLKQLQSGGGGGGGAVDNDHLKDVNDFFRTLY